MIVLADSSSSYDSYPYVCIIMLSNTEAMTGGETYIRDGNGSPRKVRVSTIQYHPIS
jgi:hypothetical protein